ncbi:hypothetical protein G5V59_03555 [Nocardioides sp. W3-2-3]|nr:hypothetical protein [Nocardioides convexus]
MSRTALPASGARDQVARLLTLVPFLHHRDGVRLDEAARLLGTRLGAGAARPQGALHVRAPGRTARRPDRRRHGRHPDRAGRCDHRGHDPGGERGVPRPATAAQRDRGIGDHRGPAHAARHLDR